MARLGADLLLGVAAERPDTTPPDMDTELGLLGLVSSGLVSPGRVGNWPLLDTLLAGG